METTYTTKSPQETIALGKKLAVRLQSGDLVLLYGELGSGKTHFIKGMANGLGVSELIKSPTYAYVNRYSISSATASLPPRRTGKCESQVFYHYDLYRLNEGDDLSSIGFEETVSDPQAINVVEWADRMGEVLPNHYIRIDLEGRGDERTIKMQFVSPNILQEDQIESYYREWATPLHVREHSKQVTKVAMQIAGAYLQKGEIVKTESLYVACMLHDMHRVCDFKELDRDRFKEEVTEEKWDRWTALREKFKGMHHADVSAQVLNERGFTETAELIRLHKAINIVKEPTSYDTLEKQIIYYADKRVKHDEIVDLAERFRDGRERYGEFNGPEDRQLFEAVEKKTHELEKELFGPIDLKPTDIY